LEHALRYWVFDRFLPQNLNARSPKTHYQYSVAFRDFATFLGREPRLEDLDDEVFAAFANWLHGPTRQICARTTNERMGRLKTVWTWLARKRFVQQFPTVGNLPVPARLPQSWTEEQLVKLFNSCRRERGFIADIPAWRWWFTIHSWWWCTAARVEETLLLPVTALDLDRAVASVTADIRKGRVRPRVYCLWPDLVLMLREILPPSTAQRERVFPWDRDISTFYNRYTRLLKRVGLPHDRYSKPHRMRVSRASWTQALGGDPTSALGHASDKTTRRHYLDPRMQRDDDGDKLFRPW
jgi:integrase